MLKFETIVIFKTGHDDAVKNTIEKYEKFFRIENSTKTKRRKVEVNTIGQKRLAYSVKDRHAHSDKDSLHDHGYYVEFKHFSTEEEIEKLKTTLRDDELVLKFLIMKCDESYKEDVIYEQFRVDAIDVIYGRSSYEDVDINIKEELK